MIALVESNRKNIDELCRKYCVATLEVFGSAADDTFDSDRSDVDFLVEFQRSEGISVADQYFGLLGELEAMFGRRVDLVCASTLRNRYFIEAVNASRELLYAA